MPTRDMSSSPQKNAHRGMGYRQWFPRSLSRQQGSATRKAHQQALTRAAHNPSLAAEISDEIRARHGNANIAAGEAPPDDDLQDAAPSLGTEYDDRLYCILALLREREMLRATASIPQCASPAAAQMAVYLIEEVIDFIER